MSRLVMMVPRSRRACGRAMLFAADGAPLLGPLRVLATASRSVARKHGNATRDVLRAFGNPPAGTYVIAGSLPPGFSPSTRRAHRFGRTGALLLTPTAGRAREAVANGRRYFYLHGGPPDRRGRLRPTRGGFRFADVDMTALLRAINDANAAGDPVGPIEVIETPSPRRVAPADKPGKMKPVTLGPNGQPVTPAPATPATSGGGVTLGATALLAAGAVILARRMARDRVGGAADDPSRRDFLALAALVTAGAFGAEACGGESERPSPEPSPACDPPDASAPPPGQCGADAGADARPCCPPGGWGAGGGDVAGGGADGEVIVGGSADDGADDPGGGG